MKLPPNQFIVVIHTTIDLSNLAHIGEVMFKESRNTYQFEAQGTIFVFASAEEAWREWIKLTDALKEFNEYQKEELKKDDIYRRRFERAIINDLPNEPQRNYRVLLGIEDPPKQTSHTCPVCGGNGKVMNGFYSQVSGQWSTSSTVFKICRSCNGSGIVWSN